MTDAMHEKAMNEAHTAFIKAGLAWQAASVDLIKERVLEEFPTAKWAELTVIIDESHMEHSIMVFDEDNNELTEERDFPREEDDPHWWLVATEGAVFGEGDYTTIYLD